MTKAKRIMNEKMKVEGEGLVEVGYVRKIIEKPVQ